VAYTCNPSYSEGSDWEDCSSKPARANILQGPVKKIPNTKRAGGVAQGVCPEFKPSATKKNQPNKKTVQFSFVFSFVFRWDIDV
jgi:hypothetical protein